MYIHYFLKVNYEDESEGNNSYVSKIKTYISTAPGKKFFYNLGGYNFSLEEIKHGLLRKNKKPMNGYF
jgi:hypothetical protein